MIHSFQYFLHSILLFLNLTFNFISFYFYLLIYFFFSLQFHVTSFLFFFFSAFLSVLSSPIRLSAKITTRFLLPLSFVSRGQRVRSSLGGHNFLLIIKEQPRRNIELGGVGIATDAITVSYGN